MKGKMYILKTDDTVEEIELMDPPSLSLLQRELGGSIEQVPYWDTLHDVDGDGNDADCVAFCNEEGKLNGLPFNHWATVFWYKCLQKQGFTAAEIRKDFLVGNIVVVTGDKALLGRL